ncbi:hypothetical protein MCEGE14_02068 [Burkholderiaceae bacterium]
MRISWSDSVLYFCNIFVADCRLSGLTQSQVTERLEVAQRSVSNLLSGKSEKSAIVSDNFAGGEMVAQYFINRKRMNIGLRSAHSNASNIRERERDFRS